MKTANSIWCLKEQLRVDWVNKAPNQNKKIRLDK